jgi:hypothetical protein
MKVDKKNISSYNRNKFYSIFFIGFSFFPIFFSCPLKQLIKNNFQQHSATLQDKQLNNHSNTCSIYTQADVIKYQKSFSDSFTYFLYSDTHYSINPPLNPSSNKLQTFFIPGLYNLPLYLSNSNLRI